MQFDGSLVFDRYGNKRYIYTHNAQYQVDIYEGNDKVVTQKTTYEEILYFLENFIWISVEKYLGTDITIVPLDETKQFELRQRKSKEGEWELVIRADYKNCQSCGKSMLLENGCKYINTNAISLLKHPVGLVPSLQVFNRKYEK